VFVSRLLPVIRTFISLPAGIAEMRFVRFSVYTFLGCLPWTFALTALGYALGSQWRVVDRFLRPVSIVVAVLVAAAAGWWLYRRWKEQRRLEQVAAASEPEEEPTADRR
jgi:membrane protein DedA with SNARE-associated domain